MPLTNYMYIFYLQDFLATFREASAGRFAGAPVGMAPQAAYRPNYGYPPQQAPWLPATAYAYQSPALPPQPRPAAYPGVVGAYPGARMASPHPSGAGQVPHQNDIVEDDIYHIDGEYYEDDGTHPSQMYNVPDSQLQQEWPFGQRAGLEGTSICL